MPDLQIFTLPRVLAACAVVFSSFVRGVAGFGLSLTLAPILLLIIEPTPVVIINLFLAIFSNIVVLSLSFKKVRFKPLLPMIISSAFGIPVGAWIIHIVSQQTLKILISGVTIVFAILLSVGFGRTFARERLFSGISGFFSGVLTSSTSLGGPPVVLFMHSQKWEKEIIHPSLAVFFTFTNSWSLVALSISGLVNGKTAMSALSLAPALLIGTGMGILVFRRINSRYFRWFSMLVIFCTGILGILSGTGVL